MIMNKISSSYLVQFSEFVMLIIYHNKGHEIELSLVVCVVFIFAKFEYLSAEVQRWLVVVLVLVDKVAHVLTSI